MSRWAFPAAIGLSSPDTGPQLCATGELPGMGTISAETPMYTGSITKQLVGVLAARAVLAGALDLDARVTGYLPLPEWLAPVRVRHLLWHAAGLPQPPELVRALGLPGWVSLDNALVLEGVRRVERPLAVPGRTYSYDNTGYVLLAEVLAAVHGVEVSRLAHDELFAPLGMTRSQLGGPAPVVLPGHDPPPGTIGDGGLWSSAADLLRWLTALNSARLGSEASELVQTPGRLDDGAPLDYAWGVAPRRRAGGITYLHAGSWPGWSAVTERNPTTQTAVVVLAQTDDQAKVTGRAAELHAELMSPRRSSAR